MKENKKQKMYETPKKVRVGTVIYDTYAHYSDLGSRQKELEELVDRVVRESRERYENLPPDLIVLPEDSLCRKTDDPVTAALKPDKRLLGWMGRLAQRADSYVLVPLFLREETADGDSLFYNSAMLIDRSGKLLGRYDKIHPVLDAFGTSFEHGLTPGKEVPVFDCDFGRLGIQICFDMDFDDGWELLKKKGAEIVAWPTESPQSIRPGWRALVGDFYIVSSTTRKNAGIFSPVGILIDHIRGDEGVLVREVDLSYGRLNFSHSLREGEAVREKWGEKVGFVYSDTEDMGLFWSNDESLSIGEMLEEMNLHFDLDRMVEENLKYLKPYRPLR